MQLKHELSTLKWSLECGNHKDHFDQQIMELREKLLEVNEVIAIPLYSSRNIKCDHGLQEIRKYRELDLLTSQRKTEEASLATVIQHSSRMPRLFRGSKSRQEREELISRYLMHLTKWAKTVMGVITRPIARIRGRMNKEAKG